jgi:hypothetical protein
MSDASELVVAGAFSLPHEAYVACSALHAAGIEARIADEHIVTTDWTLSNAVGGVKVMVRAENLAAARELLENTAVVSDDADADSPQMSGVEDSEQDVCPRCGSHALVAVKAGKRLSALSWFIIGAPLFPVWRRMRCSDCGHESR